jgi:hypothetical protein
VKEREWHCFVATRSPPAPVFFDAADFHGDEKSGAKSIRLFYTKQIFFIDKTIP